ncbi:MAG: SMP-30/gluconolactonase/LRE family protein [Ruminococcaceae bacterium]|nr:SMP-30/gluconolactonase/LRE family protein [Oscillospiraceae bacterium]
MIIQRGAVKCVHNNIAHLGEGPVWNERDGYLYYTDVHGGKLWRLDPKSGRIEKYYEGEKKIGGFVFDVDGTMTVMSNGSVYKYNGKTFVEAFRIAVREDENFNDVIADPMGRIYSGTLPRRPEDKGTGRMIRFESGKEPVELWAGMGCTNGMGFSPDEKTFYHTETGKKSITAYDYDRETGEITPRSVVYQGDGKMGIPDGMTVDAEGCIWSAFWNGYGVRRISPEGVILAEMFVPACQTSSVMFGGEDLDTLYVTSGAQGAENLETGMFEGIFLGGPLYAFKPGVHGKVEYRSKI